MSTGNRKEMTKDEASAAERTWLFHLTLTAGGGDATGLALAGADIKLSKNGAAFANAAGVCTEIASGWYKLVLAAADVDTIGELGVLIVKATADTLRASLRVKLFDEDVATISPADGALTAAKFGADALAAISSSLKQTVKTTAITVNGNFGAVSMKNAIDAIVEITGTFDSASVQMQTTEDPAAAVPVWTNRGAAIVAAGQATVAGPHQAIRAVVSSAGGLCVLAMKITIRTPIALG